MTGLGEPMTHATTADQQLLELTQQLYSLIHSLERPKGDLDELAQRAKTRFKELQEAVESYRARYSERIDELHTSLSQVADRLRASYERLREDWDRTTIDDVRKSLAEGYERLIQSLRGSEETRALAAQLHSVRPTNYKRNLFHFLCGFTGVTLYQTVLDRTGCMWVLLPVLITYFILDVTRRIWPRFNDLLIEKVFAGIVRPRERYVIPSATWFALSLTLVVAIFSQTIAQVAVLVLAVGDPLASIIGKRYGRKKLFRHKSWAGSLTFLGSTFLAVMAFLLLTRPFAIGTSLAIAGLASLTGTLTELFGGETIDDNLTIALATAGSLYLAFPI